jgi:hypothetical protein
MMSDGQKMTDAEVDAILDRIWGPAPPKPKPKAVTNDGEVIRDAIVRVSPSDPNYSRSDDGVVTVKRRDFVTINMQAYEEQQRWKREARQERRQLDPCRLGLYGPTDDEDE